MVETIVIKRIRIKYIRWKKLEDEIKKNLIL
jgi:hypothetical protein